MSKSPAIHEVFIHDPFGHGWLLEHELGKVILYIEALINEISYLLKATSGSCPFSFAGFPVF